MDPELRIRRLPEYQVTERAALDAILDEALIAHLAVVRDGSPVLLPFACARDGDSLLLHGSTGAGVLRVAAGDEVAVAVTHLDGLVFARSLFESSMHYRSAVILGRAEPLTGEDRVSALAVLSEHLMPGRADEVRAHLTKELAATLVLRLPLDRFSVKVSVSPAEDPDDGESREVWAGVVPLTLMGGPPVSSPDVPEHVPVAESASRAAARGTVRS
jgi:nitroimidazol reductase NimA-like FMN-containing flavoprotein (pyridoxamine 5'-phosphate oxidase superfamily)